MINSVFAFLCNGANIVWFVVVLPVLMGMLIWAFRKNFTLRLVIILLSSGLNLLFASSLFLSEGFQRVFPFAANGLDIAINIDKISAMFMIFVAAGFLLICLYSVFFLRGKDYASRFMFYLYISLAMINGALMSDHLGVLLFFWEGLLCTLFGLLLIGNKQNPKTAVKALALNGTADLLLMLGILITIYQSGTSLISEIHRLPLTGLSSLGFALMMLGAVGKAGSMPFHSWIPNAADDAPAPFMVAFPAALEKFLGIYLAIRIVTDIFDFQPGSGMSIAVMSLGTITIVLAVAMALIQKDMKRLLSYHAISQVGYMVLGIGTALPVGIIGGIFHMLNHVVYKSCLFMTAGSIEKQTGTTDLTKIGGLGKVMPVTMVSFIISALAISGVPPFNGFFSKELIFDAALESNAIFYIGAVLGAFLTAISFLKLGFAAFGGKRLISPENKKVRESGFGMLLPMGILAVLCILFGLYNALPLDKIISPALRISEVFSGWPHSLALVSISAIVLILAVADHVYGYKKTKSAIKAADHIHDAPGLKSIYNAAEKLWFDPYNWLMWFVNRFTLVCSSIERGVSWIYDDGAIMLVNGTGKLLQRFNNGSLTRYLLAAVGGIVGIIIIFVAMA